MESHNQQIYKFDDFQLNVCERQLFREGQVIPVPPKVFDTLLVLIENRGRLLTKDFLMQQIWTESFVEESCLTQYIFQLRKALGEDSHGSSYIETVPKRGYRFHAQLENNVVETPLLTTSMEQTAFQPVTPSNSEVAISSLVSRPLPTSSQSASSIGKYGVVFLSAFVLIGAVNFFQKMMSKSVKTAIHANITKLTTNGKSLNPALSPDGKYVAFVQEEAGRQSVWIRQVTTSGNMQIVPEAEIDYQGLTFSLDGNYLYYVAYPKPANVAALYKVPVLGGTPNKILEDIDSSVAFSADGQQMAFVRHYLDEMETAIVIANLDGKNERVLATTAMPNTYSSEGLSWSPDGKLIATAVSGADAGGNYMTVVGIVVSTGQQIPLTQQNWAKVGQIAWRKDKDGFLAVARQKDSSVFADQVWLMPYPMGEPRRVTNDLGNYSGISLSANADKLVTTQSTKVSNLWIMDNSVPNGMSKIASVGVDHYSEKLGLEWLTNKSLIFGSRASGNPDLWLINSDGSNQRQLTAESSAEAQPTVSADGKFIAYLSNHNGNFNIWQMTANGTNQTKITNGNQVHSPNYSADGQWIIYSAEQNGMPVIWKVPSSGGEPVQVTKTTSTRPTVSPDGKLVGHLQMEQKTFQMKLAVVPLQGEERVTTFDTTIAEPYLVNWSPDGKMLTYVETRNGVSNVWGQPINGKAPKQLTKFQSDHIYRFAWSKDGKNLACERGFYLNDVVLISELNS